MYSNGAARTFMPCTYNEAVFDGTGGSGIMLVSVSAGDGGSGGSSSSFGDIEASCNVQAVAFKRRESELLVTRFANIGSVASVRNVSFLILAYTGEAPRARREAYS